MIAANGPNDSYAEVTKNYPCLINETRALQQSGPLNADHHISSSNGNV